TALKVAPRPLLAFTRGWALVNANNGRGATFNAVKPVISLVAVNHVATINNNLSVSELRYRQGFQVHVITITHASGKITFCIEQVFKKVVGENHCGNPLVTDVRRPPAARCRKGPEQELMEFVLLLDELLKLVQIIRQIAEN
ncbi:hypothetical protein, partial [Pseudomonas aeruginosa]|uniref:hypothetical protein n=1 Tax=Pseudomonas aeruginosa TaxID=287 RepID=UPI0031B6A129